MATYPEGNPGVWPVEPTTDVGQFRALVGDLNATEYDPPVEGHRNFEKFSDAEIAGFISQGGGSIPRGVGYSYLYLAGQAALESKQVKDYDLTVDLTKRSADLRAIAQMWLDRADQDDANAGEDEAFEIVPTGKRGGGFIPEASIPQWGREYTIGRWR